MFILYANTCSLELGNSQSVSNVETLSFQEMLKVCILTNNIDPEGTRRTQVFDIETLQVN